jgi:hypothetical protein
MTPEELNRKIEFLVEWEARFVVRYEEDRKEFARIIKTLSDLFEIESARLYRNDEEHRKFEKEMQRLHEQWQKSLDELRRRIDGPPGNPNSNPN